MIKKLLWAIMACMCLPVGVQAVYYSQLGQDRYLNEHIFHNKKNGIFVDIGAYDGITYSNTYFFEKELGWTGICFEPHPQVFPQLKHTRQCECIDSCVAAQDGMVDFIQALGYPIMLSGMAATYDTRHFARLQQECKNYNASFTVIPRVARSLMSVLKQRGITTIDYLSLDTQGSELAILQSIDFDAVAISCISVENNYEDPAIKQFLSTKGFSLMVRLGQDEIYCRAQEKPKKIVALLPARNEELIIEQCLRALSKYADAIVYLDDASEDNTVAIVESLAKECRVERIIKKTVWYRDEPKDRNHLLQVGREIGGTHFIVLDADEMFTANCMKDNFLRNRILALQKGEMLQLNWVQLWRSVHTYRFDDSVWTGNNNGSWTGNYGGFIFCDDGISSYKSDFIHTTRMPNVPKCCCIDDYKDGYTYAVMHFQFVNWRNLLIKQAWYRCLEHIRTPQKSVHDINRRYAPSKDEVGLRLAPSPAIWFEGYDFFDAAVFDKPEQWRERQIIGWFEDYGRDYFAELDIWDIDWGAGITPE